MNILRRHVVAAAALGVVLGVGAPGRAESYRVERVFGGVGWVGKEQHTPTDIVVEEAGADGCLYVVQWRNSYVKKFRRDGTFVDWFGESRAWGGTFASPYGIAQARDGHLYLTLDGLSRIFVMTTDGGKVRTFGSKGSGDGQLNRPKGIACSPVDGLLYVVDRYNFRIQVFDTDGNLKRKWGTMGSAPGEFYLARGIAIDADGNVYVADTYNHRVQVFTAAGKFIRAFGKRGAGDGEFKYPSGIAIGPKGRVFVTDAGNGRVVCFTKEGKFRFAIGRRGTKPGEFNQPLGITVDSRERIWVADTMNHRVQVLAPERDKE